jgi:hypothetical protein
MEEEYKVDETITSSEEDDSTTTTTPDEDVEALKTKLEEAEEARRQLTARAKAAEEKLRKLNPQKLADKALPEEIVNDVKELKQERLKREFGFKHSLSPEETDVVFKFAGNDDPEKALEMPYVKGAIETVRTQKKVENNTPSSSSSATNKFFTKDASKMTADEKQKHFEEIMSSRRR